MEFLWSQLLSPKHDILKSYKCAPFGISNRASRSDDKDSDEAVKLSCQEISLSTFQEFWYILLCC